MNIHLKISLCVHVFFLAGKYQGVELWNHMVSTYLLLKEIAKRFPKELCHFMQLVLLCLLDELTLFLLSVIIVLLKSSFSEVHIATPAFS